MRLPRALRTWADDSPVVGIFLRRVQRTLRRARHAPHRLANVAMLHAGRCGSSVLADLLKQHPGFHWADEPFEAMIPAYYKMGAQHRAREVIGNRMYQTARPYFGFDSKYLPEQHLAPALADKTPEDYITLLDELGFTHYILLDRKNQLRRAISTAIGLKTGAWNATEAPKSRTTARIDPQRFVSYGREMPLVGFLDALESTYARLRVRLAGHRVLELTYEDDVEADPASGYRKVCAFLGITPVDVQVRMKKLNPHPVPSLVENYDELAAALRGTKYAWMLEA
jgi:hypothetical protein